MRVEGVGLKDVGAGFEIGVVDLADDLRLRQHQKVVIALEIVAVILEALAAIACLVQLVALDHGAHGAVEDKDTLLGALLQGFDALLAGHCAASTFAAVVAGLRPSRWQMA